MEGLFPPFKHDTNRIVSDPCVITDEDGRVLAWYLPQILTVSRRVSYWHYLRSPLTLHLRSTPCGLQTVGCRSISMVGAQAGTGDHIKSISAVPSAAHFP